MRAFTRRSYLVAIAVLALTGWPAPAADDDGAKEPAGKLVAESNWQGVHQHKQHATTKPSAARLKVTERDGEKFKGEFWLNARGARRGVKVEGEVKAKTG